MKGIVLVCIVVLVLLATRAAGSEAATCAPTRADALGPFYEPGAPIRAKVGSGYVLRGVVRSTACHSIPRARIEFWLVNPQGVYDDAHRATVIASATGRYRFESNRPVGYQGRPPHIHIRVSARGYRTLVTQHYPKPGGMSVVTFNLTLRRA